MNNSNWLDSNVLEDYLDGRLDAHAMHQLEKAALEDPFLAEAIAGLLQSPRRVQSLSILQKRLQERTAQKPIDKKRWRVTAQRLSIASAAAVLFITVSLLFWMRESRNRAQLKENAAKNVEISIAAAPAVLGVPTPVNGWETYQTYLRENNRLIKNGSTGKVVSLTFQIQQDGSPSDIKVVQGISQTIDLEAIRLVKEGPKWAFQPDGGREVKLEVQF